MTTRDDKARNDTSAPEGARDVGQGYPEEAQPGTGIDADEHPENETTPAHDAPRTSQEEDGDAGQATGNPRAAGD